MTPAIEGKSPLSPRWRRRAVAATMLVFLLLASLLHLRVFTARSAAPTRSASRAHGPWVYGRPAARFTIIEYADLECPYCRAYFPVLRHWIDEHPQVDWEWWNFPLPMHEPAASGEAVLAECAGEVGGNRAFWRAVGWIYGHARGDGAGIAADRTMPDMSPAIRACTHGARPQEVVRAQVAAATREHILGTPTVRLVDRKTDRALELQGPIDGDALLSAIDLLASERGAPASREKNSH